MNNNLSDNKQSAAQKSPQRYALELLMPYKKLLLFGFLSLIVVDVSDVLPPMILKLAFDSIEQQGEFNYLIYCGLAIVVIALVQGVFRFFWRHFFLGTAHRVTYDLRKSMFAHLLKLPFSYFNRTRVGDLMSRFTNDIQEIRFMLGIGVLILLDVSFYICTVPFLMFWLSPKLTCIILLPFLMIPLLAFLLRKHIHHFSKEVQARLSDLSSRAEENISGIRVIKGFNTEKTEIERFDKCGLKYVGDSLKLALIEAFMHPAIEFSVAIGIFLLLFFGGKMVISNEISLGDFIALQSYLLKMTWPMMAIGWVINMYQRSIASIERCQNVLQIAPAHNPRQQSEQEPNVDEIKFDNVSFAYPDSPKNCITDLSISIKKGETIGITGPVGSGKTTLLKLMMKMIDPTKGTINFSGVSYDTIPLAKLRSFFSYVPQETFLFSETIRENILFGCQNRNDTQKAVACAKLAGMDSDIQEFPHSYETILGERGVNLSGGQKQRTSLARAIASERTVLILDDCTSAVDTETEKEILSKITDKSTKQTSVIVSHRMISLQNANRIIYLEDGKIVESGSHDELIAISGKYAKAWERQRLKSELEQETQHEKLIL